jgi:hypothetical protein
MGLEWGGHRDEHLAYGSSILRFRAGNPSGADTEIGAQANPNSFGHLGCNVRVHGTFTAQEVSINP